MHTHDPAADQEFVGHTVHAVAPAAEYVLAEHVEHSPAPLRPFAAEYVPIWQSTQTPLPGS